MATTKSTYTIGIDLGGTKILTGVLNSRNELIATVKTPTGAQDGAMAVLKRITDSLDQAIAEAKLPKKAVDGIGIGVPGVFDAAAGVIVKITNIAGMENINMARLLSG